MKLASLPVTTAATLAVASLALVGCNSSKNKPANEPNPAVTDISPTPPPVQPAPVVVQPAPVPQQPITEAPAGSLPPGRYTVQRGDTLYNIATRRFGRGSQANIDKITSANPGLTPANLQAGQTITIP